MAEEMKSKRPWNLADRLAAALCVLAIAARIWGAWATRFLVVPDTAVVGLMARHMAALKEFPVFFYGQAYMGSLEPAASALMVRLLGATGFAVNLGPVWFAAAALFLLWRWARDAAGPWGGLAALVAGFFGPLVYFQFQMAARGGYMVALLVDAGAIFTAGRLAVRLRAGEEVRWPAYAGLGLLAGIGLWSNLIVAPALATAGLLLWHGMRGRFWRHGRGIAAGLAGFVAGFSPWLAYNARHGWISLEMSQMAVREPLGRAVHSAWGRFLMLQNAEIGRAGAWLPGLLAGAVLLLAMAGAAAVVAQWRRADLRENYARAGALVFCLLFALVLVQSGFARTPTARYWVPTVPGLAVLAGVACAAPARRLWRAAAWVLLVGLALTQGRQVVLTVQAHLPRARATHGNYLQIGAALDQAGARALLAPIQYYPLNFALKERVAVSDGRQKFYEPILRQVELADAIAYSADYNGAEAFLRQQGAQWETIRAGNRRLLWQVRRPLVAPREILAGQFARLQDATGADWTTALLDQNLDTAWAPGAGRPAVLECTFAAPQDVDFLQLVFAHPMGGDDFDFPRRISIEGRQNGQWHSLLARAPIPALEWSGPRLFPPGGLARPEFRLAVRGVAALRITLETPAATRILGWRLAEIVASVSEADAPRLFTRAAVESLGKWLRREASDGLVYAPRWICNELLTGGWVPEERLAGLAARAFPATESVARDGRVPADRRCVFIVEPRWRATMDRTLQAQCAGFRREAVGRWLIYLVEAGGWSAGQVQLPAAVRWTGDVLLAGGTAPRIAAALQRLREPGLPPAAQKALLEEIIRWRPAALAVLPEDEVARLGGAAAVAARRTAGNLPASPCRTEFANGVRLEGVELDPGEIQPGGELTIRLFWSAAADFLPGHEWVFVHLRDAGGRIVAQADFRGTPRLWGPPELRPPPGEITVDSRRLSVPAGTVPGPLELAVGFYDPGGRRVKVLRSVAPGVSRRAAVWPGRVQVQP